MLVLGGVAALMLTLIFVAMISKQIAGRKSAKRRAEERMVNMAWKMKSCEDRNGLTITSVRRPGKS